MKTPERTPQEKWACFRLAVISPLLSSPPAEGQLAEAIRELIAEIRTHPLKGEPLELGFSTVERWYYLARDASNPLEALRRKVRSDADTSPSMHPALVKALLAQYTENPEWTVQLHYDNVLALAEEQDDLEPVPSYASLRRFMRSRGLCRIRKKRRRDRPGMARALERLASRETRSFEMEHVHALWHTDFHEGSLPILRPSGEWVKPHLVGILDDRSRVICHAQWYLAETAEDLVHALAQALAKHGLPREFMSDNGPAMKAAEFTQGLERLSITHQPTLDYSPHQNGKQESWWGQVEGRLLPMLGQVKDLTLRQLNEATQAWIEQEYQRKEHSEIGTAPIRRLLEDPHVGRPSPTSEELRQAFTMQVTRRQRRSDGTLSLDGIRFELPSAYRHLVQVKVRYARWDLGRVYLCEARSGRILTRLYPLDRAANADGRRRTLCSVGSDPAAELAPGTGETGDGQVAPLLRKYLKAYAATGLPPAYVPKDEEDAGPANEAQTQTANGAERRSR